MTDHVPAVTVRAERPGDFAAVDRVNSLAFETELEAEIVRTLRGAGVPIVSLVAELEDGEVVGHIMFSPVAVDGRDADVEFMGLAPMAVHPRYQNQGIGSRLVEEGVVACRRIGTALLVVLGHPEFYPRFGFLQAADNGFHFSDPQLDKYFFVMRVGSRETPAGGTVTYHEAFSLEGE